MKKTISVFLELVMVICLFGCGDNAPRVTMDVPEDVMETDTLLPEPTPESVVTAEPVENDPLWPLLTTWELAMERGGTFLVDGEKLYQLGKKVIRMPGARYYKIAVDSYRMYDLVGLYTTAGEYYDCRTYGDVPVLPIHRDDQVIVINPTRVPELELYPARFLGYSFFVYTTYYGVYIASLETGEMEKIDWEDLDTMVITDENGEVLSFEETNYGLKQGQIYTIGWFEGTQYMEITSVADCRVYDWDKKAEPYVFEGVLTKDGYAVYDLTSLDIPDGLYSVLEGIVEIK